MSYEVTELAMKPWQCSLPLICRLEKDNTAVGIAEAKPCYFMVPRTGYLMLSATTIEQHFAQALGKGISDPFYFTCELTGMKQPFVFPWQYPVGVILDLLRAHLAKSQDVDLYSELPLQVTLCRYSVDPTSSVEAVPLESTKGRPVWPLTLHAMRKTGMLMVKSSIKSSLAGLYGVFDMKDLNVEQEKALEQAILDNDPRAFFPVVHTLRKVCSAKSKNPNHANFAMVKFHCEGKVIPMQIDTEQFPTIGFALREYFPCCYDLTWNDCNTNSIVPDEYAKALISGTEPPCCAPLKCLAEELASVDLYLHVVIIPVKSNEPRERPLQEEPTEFEVDDSWEGEGSASPNSKGSPVSPEGRRMRALTTTAMRKAPMRPRRAAAEGESSVPNSSADSFKNDSTASASGSPPAPSPSPPLASSDPTSASPEPAAPVTTEAAPVEPTPPAPAAPAPDPAPRPIQDVSSVNTESSEVRTEAPAPAEGSSEQQEAATTEPEAAKAATSGKETERKEEPSQSQEESQQETSESAAAPTVTEGQ